VAALKAFGILKTPRVAEAFAAVDRGFFTQPSSDAYLDAPQPIGYGATISAPHMHAHVLEYLSDKLIPSAKVLDVGSGSGYLVAVMALLVLPLDTELGKVSYTQQGLGAWRQQFTPAARDRSWAWSTSRR
jgi:protein-L-isoaspartate(D-aspartate) O-methyltransferase